jgi:hypothetical protein
MKFVFLYWLACGVIGALVPLGTSFGATLGWIGALVFVSWAFEGCEE